MHVLKFGGTSMGDENTWRRVLNIILNYQAPVVVVSATARTTRQLVAAAETAPRQLPRAREIAENIRERHEAIIRNFLSHEDSPHAKTARKCRLWIDRCIQRLHNLLADIAARQQLSPLHKDAVAGIGEQLSAYLFAQCGTAYGLSMRWVDAKKIIKTDASFGRAVPDRSQINQNVHKLATQLADNIIPVMGGFYGSDEEGRITTLGFEGSDYTASLIGAGLQAEAIEIWTDVSGIFTCDPRVVTDARPISELSFQEATELAYFGAKVLHPSTMKPASSAQIPVIVKNIFEPDHPGTRIHGSQIRKGWAKALTYLQNVIILTVSADKDLEGHQFLAEIFAALDRYKLPVNAVTTTEASVSLALQAREGVESLRKNIQSLGKVSTRKNQGLISLIGCNFDKIGSIQQQVLEAVSDLSPTLISYSKSKQNLNIALAETEVIPAVRRIHSSLFANDHKLGKQ